MIYLLVFIAVLLRIVSAGYGFPYMLGDFDEIFAVRGAVSFGVTKSLHPILFHYPAFYSYILFFLYGIYFSVGFVLGRFHNVEEFAFAYLTMPGIFCSIARVVSAVSGAGTVFIVYLIAKRCFNNRGASFIASALLAFSYLHTSMSWWAKPDITMTFLSIVAFLFIFMIAESGKIKHYLIAGFFIGLATATKYNAALLILPVSLAHIFCKGPMRNLLIGYVFIFFGFFIGASYTFLDFPAFFKDFLSISHMVQLGEVGNVGRLPYLWVIISFIKTEGLIGAVFIIGVIYSFFKPDKNKWLCLSFVVPVFLYTGMWQKNSLHYLLAVFPVMALLGGVFLAEAFKRRRLLILVTCVIILPSAINIARADYKMFHKDTRVLAKEWIEKNLMAGGRIALETVRYRDHPPIISYGAEFASIDYGPKGRKTYSSPRLDKLLGEYFNSHKTYKIYPLQEERAEAQIDVLIPSKYRGDMYVRDCYRYRWKKPQDLKREGIEYIILSSYVYKKFTDIPLPAQDSPLFLPAKEGREYFESLFSSDKLALIKEFVPDRNYGPVLKIYRIK